MWYKVLTVSQLFQDKRGIMVVRDFCALLVALIFWSTIFRNQSIVVGEKNLNCKSFTKNYHYEPYDMNDTTVSTFVS